MVDDTTPTDNGETADDPTPRVSALRNINKPHTYTLEEVTAYLDSQDKRLTGLARQLEESNAMVASLRMGVLSLSALLLYMLWSNRKLGAQVDALNEAATPKVELND